MVQSDAIEQVINRNNFYRDNYRRVLLIFLVSMLANVVLGTLLYYVVTHPPEPKYFATSVNGRVTPLTPLNKPNQSDSAVLQWANQAAIASYTYNFVDYRSQLQAASQFFTANGWRSFLNALQSSRNLEAVRAKKLIVSAVATKTPVILAKGVINGRYSWRVQMTILVTFQSASTFTQQRNVVTMLITRISTLDAPRGIGIEQLVVGPAGGGDVQ